MGGGEDARPLKSARILVFIGLERRSLKKRAIWKKLRARALIFRLEFVKIRGRVAAFGVFASSRRRLKRNDNDFKRRLERRQTEALCR